MGGMHAMGESTDDEDAPDFSYDSRQGEAGAALREESLADLRFEHMTDPQTPELTWK